MAAQITAPASFHRDFEELCRRIEATGPERQRLREAVRADFSGVGRWVIETVAVYRFCDETWGHLPSPELCEGYLASKRWWPADPGIFKSSGVMLLARLCAQVAGVIPMDVPPPAGSDSQ